MDSPIRLTQANKERMIDAGEVRGRKVILTRAGMERMIEANRESEEGDKKLVKAFQRLLDENPGWKSFTFGVHDTTSQ